MCIEREYVMSIDDFVNDQEFCTNYCEFCYFKASNSLACLVDSKRHVNLTVKGNKGKILCLFYYYVVKLRSSLKSSNNSVKLYQSGIQENSLQIVSIVYIDATCRFIDKICLIDIF